MISSRSILGITSTLPLPVPRQGGWLMMRYRGAGTSIPFSCSESAEAAKLVQWAYREVATNASDVAMGQLWAQAKTKSDACQNGPGNATARLIGTPFTARDFIQVVDALGEDGMLRYWGKDVFAEAASSLSARLTNPYC